MLENFLSEVTIIYHSDKPSDRQVITDAEKRFGHIRKVNVKIQRLTGTRLEEIATRLGCSLKEMIDSQTMHLVDRPIHNFESDYDYIKLLRHNPEFLCTPIIISRDRDFAMKGVKEWETFCIENPEKERVI